MLGRVVEIAENARHLSLYRGFLIVQDKSKEWKEIGRVPLDDILAVIAHAHAITYTNNVLVELAQRSIPFVLCSDMHEVVGMLMPIAGHHQQAKRFDAQIAMTLPKRKSLWADIVRAKIGMQIWSLSQFGLSSQYLETLLQTVRSGDVDNKEAQAAREYWKLLFGPLFLRDRNAYGINGLLNYGYTIFRSAMARAVVAAGLHPTVGLHHANEFNAMRLVDDLIEPFRPVVDVIVKKMTLDAENPLEVNAANKRLLVRGLFIETELTQGKTPVMVAMQKLAASLASVVLGEQSKLSLPITFDFEEDDDLII